MTYRLAALAFAVLAATAQTAAAATIQVGADCSLGDALRSANTDTAVGGCRSGARADVVVLSDSVTLTAMNNERFGATGLPVVESAIHLVGPGHTIRRDANAPRFRLLAVAASGQLTVDGITLSGGRGDDNPLVTDTQRSGGAIIAVAGATVQLDAVTLRDNHSPYGGGALYASEATVRMRGSTIEGNRAGALGTLDGAFGGALLVNGGRLEITDSAFIDNRAEDPSTLYATFGGAVVAVSATVEIHDSRFERNAAKSRGGALDLLDSSAGIYGTTFTENVVGNGRGGAMALFNTRATAAFLDLRANSASLGGGLLVGAGSTAVVRDSLFDGNTAGPLGEGGAVAVDQGRLTLERSALVRGVAKSGAGLYVVLGGEADVVNTTFSGNTGRTGTAIHLQPKQDLTADTPAPSRVSLTHVTVTGNASTWPLGGSGGVLVESSSLSLGASIIAGNTARGFLGRPSAGEQIGLFAPRDGSATVTSRGDSLLGTNDFSGVAASGDGEANIGVSAAETFSGGLDGLFAGGLDDSARLPAHLLRAGSPAIGRASRADCTAAPVNGVDQRGAARSTADGCDAGAIGADATAQAPPAAPPPPTFPAPPPQTAPTPEPGGPDQPGQPDGNDGPGGPADGKAASTLLPLLFLLFD